MGYEVVVIGTSQGGLQGLEVLLADLPAHFPSVVAIVQHRSKEVEDMLASLLQEHRCLPVQEAEDKMPMVPGHVYLAPADFHLLVEPGRFALSSEEPVWCARPSIDVLFESCADAYGSSAIGVILTGANADGAQGLAAIKARGGLAIVQDPKTAENRVMCDAALAATAVDKVLPLEEIGPFLAEVCIPLPKPAGATAALKGK